MEELKYDWMELQDRDIIYHQRQLEKPFRSTEKFVEWLAKEQYLKDESTTKICDMACGGGGNLYYMAKTFPHVEFYGIELNPQLVEMGNKWLKKEQMDDRNKLMQGNIYKLNRDLKNVFNGIISFQFLVGLPDYKEALKAMTELEPDWIAFSSLFYEGNIDFTVRAKDYDYGIERYYNVYSLRQVENYLGTLGYKNMRYVPFDIDIDLPKPKTEGFGAYTIKTEKGKRLQISGAVLLPWYFVVASK